MNYRSVGDSDDVTIKRGEREVLEEWVSKLVACVVRWGVEWGGMLK